MNQCQLFGEFHCTHAKDNKKMLARNSMFFMRNIMTFLKLHIVKLRQCIVSKDHISMNNGDNFIKFAG